MDNMPKFLVAVKCTGVDKKVGPRLCEAEAAMTGDRATLGHTVLNIR